MLVQISDTEWVDSRILEGDLSSIQNADEVRIYETVPRNYWDAPVCVLPISNVEIRELEGLRVALITSGAGDILRNATVHFIGIANSYLQEIVAVKPLVTSCRVREGNTASFEPFMIICGQSIPPGTILCASPM